MIKMYYYIKGKPVLKGVSYVVIDVNGVGYLINTSQTSLNLIKEGAGELTMYTVFIVREDAQELYGFTTNDEKNMFESLISVSGVGPKAAVSILSVTTPAELARAVITDNVKTITKAQGVGPKIAKRIILELRENMKNADLDLTSDDEGTTAAVELNDARGDAISALMALGYNRDEALKAVGAIEGELRADELIKKELLRLM